MRGRLHFISDKKTDLQKHEYEEGFFEKGSFICCHNSNFTTGGDISGGNISSSFSSIKYFFSRLDHCKNICKLLNLLKQQHIHLCCNKHVTRLMDHCNHLRNTCNKSFHNKNTFPGGKFSKVFFLPIALLPGISTKDDFGGC